MYTCDFCFKNPGIMQQLDHDGPSGEHSIWQKNLVTGGPLVRCPIRDVIEASPELRAEFERYRLVYYPNYKKGHLLVSGGIAEQPNRWMEGMTHLTQLEHRQEVRWHEIRDKPASD